MALAAPPALILRQAPGNLFACSLLTGRATLAVSEVLKGPPPPILPESIAKGFFL